ncbi:MAG: DUF4003 domain-containing protein [Peptococcaceae bacterium]|nr:DUF4003 domain-containing protein [Peptococcaceae bacterium]
MDLSLRLNVDKLINIYRQVSKDFKWKNSGNMNNLIALSYVMKGKDYIKEEIEQVNAYLKQNTGPFSCYRQKSVLFSALLVLNFPDPKAKFDILLDYEERLKQSGFRSYTYRPVTAYTLLLTCAPNKVDLRIAKAYEIFKAMRKAHPWLTSGDDYPLSILLAETEKPTSVLMSEIEGLYQELHQAGFPRSNGLQFLSHVLSLSRENNKEKAERCRKLYTYFKENKLKVYSRNYGSLGLLTLLGGQSDKAAMTVKEVCEYLREDRSIRWLGKEALFLTATSLVTFVLLERIEKGSDLIQTNAFVTIESLMAAQNAAMLGATCAAYGTSMSGN